MSECVILFRNIQNNRIGCVIGDRDEIAVMPNREAAEEAARNTTVCRAFPYQIVEVDEI
jgi:hypothetical protein